ncbi:hypothetical protein ONS95_007485 [Cadophora gregata]|uniref:uncharacterized protein n=1 Tax=Cadophora gregata TaxID=51156 RepID=UPI0026DBCE3B|nr:uncharacterized protein ONS95_007485 [Cadophora gregata]KAK0125854.1 hypothetical protein ONS95_007485 [Cadophora gregata]
MTEPKEEELEGEDGGNGTDMDGIPEAFSELAGEVAVTSSNGANSNSTSKRKAAGTPSTSAPPCKKPTVPARKPTSTSISTPKTILARLQATKSSTPRTPATRRRTAVTEGGDDDDPPDITPRTLGARAIARLTEKASNDPSRDLQPIRRPLPPRFQDWNSDSDSDIGAHDSSSDDEPSVPPPTSNTNLTNPHIEDPFYNQDLSDSDASTGISESPNGTPRAYSPSAPGPDTLHPFSTSAKYRIMPPRGIVKNPDGSTIDFDSCMTFPEIPDLETLNRNKNAGTKKMEDVGESVIPQRKVVLMSFSDNITTPDINWTVHKTQTSSSNANTNSDKVTIGEPLSPPLHSSSLNLSTTGDAIMLAYIEANNRAKAKAKEKKQKGKGKKGGGDGEGDGVVRKKKKALRQPKYEKRKYTWKDSTRKNKGRLYDTRKAEAEGEKGCEGEGEE